MKNTHSGRSLVIAPPLRVVVDDATPERWLRRDLDSGRVDAQRVRHDECRMLPAMLHPTGLALAGTPTLRCLDLALRHGGNRLVVDTCPLLDRLRAHSSRPLSVTMRSEPVTLTCPR